jgi:membrane-associated phospholipid phosphatase
VFLLLLFVALGYAAGDPSVRLVDAIVILMLRAWTSPPLILAMRAATNLGSGYVVGVICTVEAILLYRSGARVSALVLLMAIASTTLAVEGAKQFFGYPRPHVPPPLVDAPGYSYPSGHTALATVAYGFSGVLLAPRASSRILRSRIILFATTLILVVAFSRVCLGVHYPVDVIGGMLLGCAWASLWYSALRALTN